MSVPVLSVNESRPDRRPVKTSAIEPSRVLSIQSHVVSGYVGNKAATFPLQLLGWDVDVVNTVQLSNHTGYGHTAGTKTSAADLESIFDGLRSNGLFKAARLLTGYIPGGEAVQAVGNLASQLKTERLAQADGSDLVYVLDPVMGDHGTLYVADSVIPIYRSLLPLATIITPNQFEAETLANMKITSLPSLHALLTHLHTTYSLPHIIITSFSLPSPLPSSLFSLPSPPASYQTRLAQDLDRSARDPSAHEQLLSVASSWTGRRTDGVEQPEMEKIELETTLFQFPQIPGYFSGVGDLFSSLTLAHFSPPSSSSSSSSSSTSPSAPTPSPLATAASRALYSTQHILLSTHLRSQQLQAAAGDQSDDEADARDRARRVARMRRRELGLIGKDARVDLEGGGVWEGTKVDLLDG